MATNKQLLKLEQLWSQWNDTHDAAVQALSLAVNIHQRLQELDDPATFPVVPQQQLKQQQPQMMHKSTDQHALQTVVVSKQLESLDRALARLRRHHELMHQVVRDLERLYVEAVRGLNGVKGKALSTAAVPTGPQPSLVQMVETVQCAWVMCRDEWLLKVAVLGMIHLDATPLEMSSLLTCYKAQPNVDPSKVEAVLGIVKQTMQQDKL